MGANPYRLSFTTGDLFYQEAIKAAQLFFEYRDWKLVRDQIIQNNLFQSRTRASSGRILRELLPRLQLLNEEQLHLLLNGSRQEQSQVLWLAVCKQYHFIEEFIVTIVREKLYRLESHLSYIDFDAFFNAKAEWHEELDRLTEMTRKKMRRVLFQMMREAGILSEANEIRPVIISPQVARSLSGEDANYSSVFLITEADFKRQAAL